MPYDKHSNFGSSTVAVAPAPALTGLSLTVSAGQGALFPVAPFNCTVWPSGVAPTAANAEIVRVTSVVGDVLTIVRAQEGTAAVAIAVGFQIANTGTNLVFTDIEDSIIQFISAGGGNASAPGVSFGNANGITFGVVGQTITASHDGLTMQSTQPVAASASNGSFLFSTLQFTNANNVTFGTSAGGIIFASVAAGVPQTTQPVAASASNGSFLFSTLAFSNANGITFGTSAGSIITASVGAAPGQSTQPVAASASNGSFLFSTLAFSNANGITFGTSAGSIITASVGAAPGQTTQPVAASASNGSFLFSTLGFSNANGVTFGTSAGSIITASISTFGDRQTVSFFQNEMPNNTSGPFSANISNSSVVLFQVPEMMSISYVRFIGSFTNNQAITLSTLNSSMNGSAEVYSTFYAQILSLGTGASSNSLINVALGSSPWTIRNSISVGADGTSGSYTQGITGQSGGNSFTFSTQYTVANTVYSFSSLNLLSNYSGVKFIDVNLATSLNPGAYFMLIGYSSSSATNSARMASATSNIINFRTIYGNNGNGAFYFSPMGATNTVSGFQFGGCAISTNSPQTFTGFNASQLSVQASLFRPLFQLIRQA